MKFHIAMDIGEERFHTQPMGELVYSFCSVSTYQGP